MRSLLSSEIYQTAWGEVQVCIALPYSFVVEQQQQLLDWDVAVSYLIPILQRSSVPLDKPTGEAAIEKDRLRARFLRFGCSLVFALQDLGYSSDLFDPRTGYPLIARRGIAFDDNAAVAAILNYEKIEAGECSLLVHPFWQYRVYPSSIITAAPLEAIEFQLKRILLERGWRLTTGGRR